MPYFLSAGGPAGITALAFNLSIVVVLALLFGCTLAVPLRTIAAMFVGGGVMMAVALILERSFSFIGLKDFVGVAAPFLEATPKMVPLLIYLRRCNRFSIWTFGVSDCMLMGAASGGGFAFVSDAFRHSNEQWHNCIQWLPTAELITAGYLVSGHAVWSAIAGAAIGVCVLLVHHRKLGMLIAILGFSWGLIDQLGAGNAGSQNPDSALQFCQLITAKGTITPYIFIGTTIGAIALDTWVLSRWLPGAEKFKLPRSGESASGLSGLWDFVLDRRRLAYANFKRKHLLRDPSSNMAVAIIAQSLINKHSPNLVRKFLK